MRRSFQTLARLRARVPAPFGSGVTVLGYHQVDATGDELAVTPATFAVQMAALAELDQGGTPTMALDQALDALGTASAPRRAVVLTFDDAWADNHTYALEELVRHALPAVVYAPSRLLGRPGYMTTTQLTEMADSGVTIGAHTRSHPDLRRCSDAELDDEIRGSKQDLEDLLGRDVTSFAYPTGLFDARVEAAVAAAGYRSAVTTRRGWLRAATPPFRIPRSFVEEFDRPTFVAAATGGFTALRPIDAARQVVSRP